MAEKTAAELEHGLIEPETRAKPRPRKTSLKDMKTLYEELKTQVDDTHNSMRNEQQDLKETNR